MLQVLIEKYGLSEEQLAPKLARLAKQVGSRRGACTEMRLQTRAAGCNMPQHARAVAAGRPPGRSWLQPACPAAATCLPSLVPKCFKPSQGYTIKKSASGTADGTGAVSEREGSVKGKYGMATSSATASVQAATKEAGATNAPAASSGGVMALPHGGTAAAAMAAAQLEAEHQAHAAALMQQLAVQQQLQEAQLAAAAMQAQAAAHAAAQAQAAAQGMLGGSHMLMAGGQFAPGPVGAAGMNLLLDDEFLDEVRAALCALCCAVLCMLRVTLPARVVATRAPARGAAFPACVPADGSTARPATHPSPLSALAPAGVQPPHPGGAGARRSAGHGRPGHRRLPAGAPAGSL